MRCQNPTIAAGKTTAFGRYLAGVGMLTGMLCSAMAFTGCLEWERDDHCGLEAGDHNLSLEPTTSPAGNRRGRTIYFCGQVHMALARARLCDCSGVLSHRTRLHRRHERRFDSHQRRLLLAGTSLSPPATGRFGHGGGPADVAYAGDRRILLWDRPGNRRVTNEPATSVNVYS